LLLLLPGRPPVPLHLLVARGAVPLPLEYSRLTSVDDALLRNDGSFIVVVASVLHRPPTAVSGGKQAAVLCLRHRCQDKARRPAAVAARRITARTTTAASAFVEGGQWVPLQCSWPPSELVRGGMPALNGWGLSGSMRSEEVHGRRSGSPVPQRSALFPYWNPPSSFASSGEQPNQIN
jgi:hypothetical protein